MIDSTTMTDFTNQTSTDKMQARLVDLRKEYNHYIDAAITTQTNSVNDALKTYKVAKYLFSEDMEKEAREILLILFDQLEEVENAKIREKQNKKELEILEMEYKLLAARGHQ